MIAAPQLPLAKASALNPLGTVHALVARGRTRDVLPQIEGVGTLGRDSLVVHGQDQVQSAVGSFT